MKKMPVIFILLVSVLLIAPAHAVEVPVSMSGSVFFNAIGDPPLSGVSAGDAVVMSFKVDSDNFVDGVPGDTRGYVIDESSFSLSFDTPLDVGLLNPFPGTPYFTLVDGFPVSDGFFVSSSPVSPGGAALAQEPYQVDFDLGYLGDTLGSLDILDAAGTYGFDGLTRFSFNLWSISPDFPALGIDFVEMTIVPEPSAVALLLPVLLMLRRKE